jgi:hypothetical protein
MSDAAAEASVSSETGESQWFDQKDPEDDSEENGVQLLQHEDGAQYSWDPRMGESRWLERRTARRTRQMRRDAAGGVVVGEDEATRRDYGIQYTVQYPGTVQTNTVLGY